jgi:hypothetical protein
MGQNLAIDTGDLFILNSCLDRLTQIKHPQTKAVFRDILQLWTLTVIKNDESISEDSHGEIEKLIAEFCEKLTPEVLGILESVSAGETVIGSPFADESGHGFEKYMSFVLSQPKKDRAEYWKLVAER